MSERRIFTFWEPKGSMPAYLQLCRETWRRNSPGRTLVELNYDNLEHYTGPDVLDLEILKTVSLPGQKDAILFALLLQNGGIFSAHNAAKYVCFARNILRQKGSDD